MPQDLPSYARHAPLEITELKVRLCPLFLQCVKNAWRLCIGETSENYRDFNVLQDSANRRNQAETAVTMLTAM